MYGEVGVINMNNQMMNDQINNQNSMNGQINHGLNGQVNQNPINRNEPRGKVMSKSAQTNSKYTENWLPLKAISNGVMYNNKNEMITGVKVQPRNIFILDQASMDNALIGLMNFYNTIDFEFWLVVADRPVDIAVYQAELQVLYNKTQDQRIRKLISQDMNKGDYFINNDVVDTEYFLLFKERNGEMMQKKLRNMINNLAGAGLVASQTTNDDLRLIIDNFLNGGRKYESGGVMPL